MMKWVVCVATAFVFGCGDENECSIVGAGSERCTVVDGRAAVEFCNMSGNSGTWEIAEVCAEGQSCTDHPAETWGKTCL